MKCARAFRWRSTLSMAKTDSITNDEFMMLYRRLVKVSSTWGDLWITLFLLRAENSRIISIKYCDIEDDRLHLAVTTRFPPRTLRLSETLCQLFKQRKKLHPEDVYVFQSKSNRVKGSAKPVTVIAMNMALKEAARGITDKNVSMKSAQRVVDCKVFDL